MATAVAPLSPSLPGTAFLPKRNLPAPRGRFTTIDPSRAAVETLFRKDGKTVLESLLAQVPHRVALLRALEPGYAGRRGQPLDVGDVEDLLETHELFATIETKEKAGIIGALVEQQGALGRAAYHLGLTRQQLEQLIEALRLSREVTEIRQRFVKQALSPENLALRLELLFRSRYLEDLGIAEAFEQRLRHQLSQLLHEIKDAAPTMPSAVDLLSRQLALHAESLRRAIEKLRL